MSAESASRPPHSWGIGIVLLLVLYVLSIGPIGGFAIWLDNDTFTRAVEIGYWPLTVEWPLGQSQKETLLFYYSVWWANVVFRADVPLFIPVHSR